MSTLEVLAPITGKLIPLESVNDEVFATGILGQGVAITPDSDTVVAPISGQIVSVLPHAYGIRADDGTELLLHIGLETVELEGKHFKPRVTEKVPVQAGEELTAFNRKRIAKAGYDTSVIVVVTNSKDCANIDTDAATQERTVQLKDVIMKVTK
ncbi:MAG: PTS glucose transporter subunit IIA [Flaviflexus sp.]|uniref:PTS sugar transporter subunit IIA n=1 Tax=Flaviflexus sp. TaxID=1969482 RepID=UPI00352E502E